MTCIACSTVVWFSLGTKRIMILSWVCYVGAGGFVWSLSEVWNHRVPEGISRVGAGWVSWWMMGWGGGMETKRGQNVNVIWSSTINVFVYVCAGVSVLQLASRQALYNLHIIFTGCISLRVGFGNFPDKEGRRLQEARTPQKSHLLWQFECWIVLERKWRMPRITPFSTTNAVRFLLYWFFSTDLFSQTTIYYSLIFQFPIYLEPGI